MAIGRLPSRSVPCSVWPDLRRIPDERLRKLECQRRDPVDHDKWVADQGRLYCRGAARHDRGAGVEERFAGVGDEMDVGQSGSRHRIAVLIRDSA